MKKLLMMVAMMASAALAQLSITPNDLTPVTSPFFSLKVDLPSDASEMEGEPCEAIRGIFKDVYPKMVTKEDHCYHINREKSRQNMGYQLFTLSMQNAGYKKMLEKPSKNTALQGWSGNGQNLLVIYYYSDKYFIMHAVQIEKF